jgi:hypothetical protein
VSAVHKAPQPAEVRKNEVALWEINEFLAAMCGMVRRSR